MEESTRRLNAAGYGVGRLVGIPVEIVGATLGVNVTREKLAGELAQMDRSKLTFVSKTQIIKFITVAFSGT